MMSAVFHEQVGQVFGIRLGLVRVVMFGARFGESALMAGHWFPRCDGRCELPGRVAVIGCEALAVFEGGGAIMESMRRLLAAAPGG